MADPDDLTRAAEMDRLALEALDKGQLRRAIAYRLAARALRGDASLLNAKQDGKVGGMTPSQRADRASAISKALTKGTRDPLQKAIAKSEWKTHNRYARERLHISPGMLTGYKTGKYTIPQHVHDLIKLDFGLKIGRLE